MYWFYLNGDILLFHSSKWQVQSVKRLLEGEHQMLLILRLIQNANVPTAIVHQLTNKNQTKTVVYQNFISFNMISNTQSMLCELFLSSTLINSFTTGCTLKKKVNIVQHMEINLTFDIHKCLFYLTVVLRALCSRSYASTHLYHLYTTHINRLLFVLY